MSRSEVAATDVMAMDLRRSWSTDATGGAARVAPRYERLAWAVRRVVRVL